MGDIQFVTDPYLWLGQSMPYEPPTITIGLNSDMIVESLNAQRHHVTIAGAKGIEVVTQFRQLTIQQLDPTGAPPPVGTSSSTGTSERLAREDHTHQGVTSINGLSGAVTLELSGARSLPAEAFNKPTTNDPVDLAWFDTYWRSWSAGNISAGTITSPVRVVPLKQYEFEVLVGCNPITPIANDAAIVGRFRPTNASPTQFLSATIRTSGFTVLSGTLSTPAGNGWLNFEFLINGGNGGSPLQLFPLHFIGLWLRPL